MNKNIKTVIGFLIAFIIGISTTVGATTIFNSKDITYVSDKTTKTNVKASLDELYTNLGKCPKGQYCFGKTMPLSIVEVGDYISMTPTSTSYTITKDLTGYSQDQTINPSELNLWRVIKVKDDRTIEVVSHYISSERIFFEGKIGFYNLVYVLKEAAAHYINDKYVIYTRHMGYNGQTEKCIGEIKDCLDDVGYQTDLELVTNAIGKATATAVKGDLGWYHLSSRHNRETSGFKIMYRDGNVSSSAIYSEKTNFIDQRSGGLRPILTLKSDLKIISGDGKSTETAYILE